MKLGTRNTLAHSLSHTPKPSPGPIRRLIALLPKHVLYAILAIAAAGVLPASTGHAALTYSGNIDPADPAAWTSSTTAYVGRTADGSLTLDGGSTVTSGSSYLGNDAGATGTVTVAGSGSKWTGGSTRYVGYNGTGIMNVTNGGSVTNTSAYIGYSAGSMGAVTVDGSGSAWTNSSSLYVGYN